MADLLQKQLGDPSGQSSAYYWNSWFEKVCGQTKEGFEWYCDAKEIARLLQFYFEEVDREALSIIHPGSGNSNVPSELRNTFGFSTKSKQCIIDCSEVAIQEMESKTQENSESSSGGKIEFKVGDVLKPPLPYSDRFFDVWIDKGLVDALFSGSEIDCDDCEILFREAHRVLKRKNGVCIVITLGQEHTVKLLLQSIHFLPALQEGSVSNTSCWQRNIDIHEIAPLSDASSLRPFAFVFRTCEKTGSHQDDIEEVPILRFFDQETIIKSEIGKNVSAQTVNDILEDSRQTYQILWEHKRQEKLMALQKQHLHSNDEVYMLTTLHIKPWDIEYDLNSLAGQIKHQHQNITWKEYALVPIGFGLCRLEMRCIVKNDYIDQLRDNIQDDNKDSVQSVDVDWEQSVRVMNPSKFISERNST